ncbi:hypothetical protein [Nocardioides ultimimeridianus]
MSHTTRIGRIASLAFAVLGSALLSPGAAHATTNRWNTDPYQTGCASNVYNVSTVAVPGGHASIKYSRACGTDWIEYSGARETVSKRLKDAILNKWTRTDTDTLGWSYSMQVTAPGTTAITAQVTIGTTIYTAACSSACSWTHTSTTISAGRYNAGIYQHAAAAADGSYGGQCAIWVENIIRAAGGPSVYLGTSGGSGYQAAWANYATQITSWSSVRPGDIVQFYTSARGPHTAIIMSGASESSAQTKWSNNASGDLRVHSSSFQSLLNYFGPSSYKIWRVK